MCQLSCESCEMTTNAPTFVVHAGGEPRGCAAACLHWDTGTAFGSANGPSPSTGAGGTDTGCAGTSGSGGGAASRRGRQHPGVRRNWRRPAVHQHGERRGGAGSCRAASGANHLSTHHPAHHRDAHHRDTHHRGPNVHGCPRHHGARHGTANHGGASTTPAASSATTPTAATTGAVGPRDSPRFVLGPHGTVRNSRQLGPFPQWHLDRGSWHLQPDLAGMGRWRVRSQGRTGHQGPADHRGQPDRCDWSQRPGTGGILGLGLHAYRRGTLITAWLAPVSL